uniref:Ig-like domain-containing protein n=1 Tax=Esox lucius TaxID=8010 RepID=A0A6Q2Y113_ESOLU
MTILPINHYETVCLLLLSLSPLFPSVCVASCLRLTSEFHTNVCLTSSLLKHMMGNKQFHPTSTYPTSPYTGETVTLTCSVNSESNWRYNWYKDGTYIPVTQSGRLSITENTLTISSVKVSDKGSYQCHGYQHDRPTSTSTSNQVTITVKGELDTLLSTLKLYPTSPYTGEKVTLTCSVNSESNWRYTWNKDGIYIPVTQSGRLSITENTLTISSVKVSDKGSYRCHGNLDDRPTSTSTSNQVTITVKGDSAHSYTEIISNLSIHWRESYSDLFSEL